MRILIPTEDAPTLVCSYLTKLKEIAQLSECQGLKIGPHQPEDIPTKKLDELSDAQVLSLVQGIVEGKVGRFDLNRKGLFLVTSATTRGGLTELELEVRHIQSKVFYLLFIVYSEEVLQRLVFQLKAA